MNKINFYDASYNNIIQNTKFFNVGRTVYRDLPYNVDFIKKVFLEGNNNKVKLCKKIIKTDTKS